MKRLRRGGLVSRAARLVPVSDVLGWLGVSSPGTPPNGVSVKVMCPFSETHPPDRSGEKDMRLYSDNKVYCHICTEQHDSVSLAAQAWGLTRPEAARAILARAGLDLVGDEEPEALVFAQRPEQLRTGAVAALSVWADANGIERFSPKYVRCLELADQIFEPEHVSQWLEACKTFLDSEVRRA